MDVFVDLLMIILPSSIVFLAVFFTLRAYLNNDLKKKEVDLRADNHKIITPLKLQAFERLSLFLERINPESLISRVYVSTMTVDRFHQALLATVRAEFEHNLSQQIYISEKTWQAVKNSKESVVQIINTAASTLDNDAQGIELSKKIVDTLVALNNSPTGAALKMIKFEVNTLM